MLTNVTVTGTNYYKDVPTPEIISIYRDIFPEKIEEKYVELSNLLLKYSEEVISLLNSEENIDTISNRFNSNDNMRVERTLIGDQLVSRIMSIGDKPMEKETLKKIMEQFNNYIEISSKEVKENQEHDRLEQIYDENRFSAGNAHNAIESLIPQIKEKIQEINGLSINGIDRLDRIQVLDDRHLSRIDNIFELTPQIKDSLKKLLKSYSNMRVAAFKTMIEQSYEICDAYKSGELIDRRIQYEPRSSKQNLVYLSLIILSKSFIDKLDELTISKINERFVIDRSNDFCSVMDWYTSYFKGERLDIEEIDQFITSDNSDVSLEPIVTLRNTVFNTQYLEEKENLHSK